MIIGLLVGGILAGADLIKAAKLNKIISEREQITTALNTFYLKYNCIPGDCYNISTYLSGETNGDGDEMLDNASAPGAIAELFTAWKHMSTAGLYPGSYSGLAGADSNWDAVLNTNAPASKAISKAGYTFVFWYAQSGNSTYWNGNYGNQIHFGKDGDGGAFDYAALKPADSFSIDKKVDDGIPGIGKVRSKFPDIGTCSTSGSAYNAPASSAYYISNDSIACRLTFLLE